MTNKPKPKSSSEYFYDMMVKSNLSTHNNKLYKELTRIKDDKENNINGKGLPLKMGMTLKGVDDTYGNNYRPPLLATIFFTAIFVALVTLAAMNPIGGLIIGAIVCLVPLGICLFMTLKELEEYSDLRSGVRSDQWRDVQGVQNNPERMDKYFQDWLYHNNNVESVASHLWETTCDQQLDDALIYEILGRIKYKNVRSKKYSEESIKQYCNSIPIDLSDRINRILEEIIDTKGDLGKIRYSPLRNLIHGEGFMDDREEVIKNLREMENIFKSSNQPGHVVESDTLLGADASSGINPGVTTPSPTSQAMHAPHPEPPESMNNP